MVSANNESGLDADQYHTNGFYVQDQIGYASDPVNPDLYIQREEDQARGIERNGNIRSNLSIHFAYACNLAKIKKSEIHQDTGRLKENAPVNSDGGFIKYWFDKGLLNGLSLWLVIIRQEEGIPLTRKFNCRNILYFRVEQVMRRIILVLP